MGKYPPYHYVGPFGEAKPSDPEHALRTPAAVHVELHTDFGGKDEASKQSTGMFGALVQNPTVTKC